ncbi:hypothetical protein V8G54_007917 [Vigna mungo]|uniref:Uncharacterized protein n=1 Tax=Vigna mungo TaxID=3915 RepID=A0AAQ3P2S2_VIGMU
MQDFIMDMDADFFTFWCAIKVHHIFSLFTRTRHAQLGGLWCFTVNPISRNTVFGNIITIITCINSAHPRNFFPIQFLFHKLHLHARNLHVRLCNIIHYFLPIQVTLTTKTSFLFQLIIVHDNVTVPRRVSKNLLPFFPGEISGPLEV